MQHSSVLLVDHVTLTYRYINLFLSRIVWFTGLLTINATKFSFSKTFIVRASVVQSRQSVHLRTLSPIALNSPVLADYQMSV